MSMCITRFLQNYFKKFILKIVFMTFPYRNIRLIKVNKNLSVAPPSSGVQATCPTYHTLDTPMYGPNNSFFNIYICI